MEFDGSLTCTVSLEWLNVEGSNLIRKLNHKTATLRLIRNNLRDMFIEIRAEKSNVTTKLQLRNILVFNKFMTEGKASIKFKDSKCTLLLSNAPSTQLIDFLKTIFIKITGQNVKATSNLLREQLLSNKSLGRVQEISPATTAEVKRAKEIAETVTRATITTPSPGNTKKRKFVDENALKGLKAKKLYENPTLSQLTNEQSRVLEAALGMKNIFFTGSAGTGKSFLLKRIIAALPPDVTVATASTGVAACHIGGITLHQFAGIGIGNGSLNWCYERASRPTVASVWKKTKHLVIDEISMVDGDFFDKIEAVARYVRKNDRPFGGIQLILCGDFLQLPPISKGTEKVKFCFQSEAWNKCVHYSFELEKVHRQNDPVFINVLNSIRLGKITEEIANTLKATSKQKIESDGILATKLCSHVEDANAINDSQLKQLPGESKVYVAQDSNAYMTEMLDQQLPVLHNLVLKIGAQVMLLKNINVASGLVNGARGVVTKFVNDVPLVHFRSGENYEAKIEKWTIKTSNGSFIFRKQIPLKLAWAFSIHKSQGLTLDCVEMNLTRVFDAGQAYVALSRAQSLKYLRVLNFNTQQVWANTTVLEFYRRFRQNLHAMEIVPVGKKRKVNKRLIDSS